MLTRHLGNGSQVGPQTICMHIQNSFERPLLKMIGATRVRTAAGKTDDWSRLQIQANTDLELQDKL